MSESGWRRWVRVRNGGWLGLVLRRALADRVLVAGAGLVVLVASAVLVAGAAYPALAARQGAIARLGDADPLATAVSVTLDVAPDAVEATDATIRGGLDAALGPLRGELVETGLSDTYDAGLEGGTYPPLTRFAFVDGLETRARLLEGTWPAPGATPVEAVVTPAAAARLGVGVGDRLDLDSRGRPTRSLAVRITGIAEPADRADPAWGADPLLLDGSATVGPFTTVGPLFVDREDLLDRTVVSAATLAWRAIPAVERLDTAAIPGVAARVSRLRDDLVTALGTDRSIRVSTELPAMLGAVSAGLTQAGAASTVIGGQLLVLAVYALVFVATLVVDRRRVGSAVLASRGARPADLLWLAFVEAAVIAVPAAVVGVPLGALLVAGLAALAMPGSVGASFDPGANGILLAGGTVLVAIAGLVAPVGVSVGPLARLRGSTIARRGGALVVRSWLDLGLVGLAVLGLWQLRSAAAASGRPGTPGFDLVDLAAPALGLLGGAVLSIRLTPLLGRAVERLLARGTAVAGSLAGRGIGRDAAGYARPVLLLVAATGIAVYSIGFQRTWSDSQRDQMAHALGGDIVGTPDAAAGPRALEAAAGYLAIPGVTRASAVVRETFDLGQGSFGGRLLAIPAAPALAAGAARPDQASAPLASLLDGLAQARPMLPRLEVPPGTTALRVTMDAELASAGGTGPVPAGWDGLAAALVVQDPSGTLSRLGASPREPHGAGAFEVPLPGPAADGLGIVAVEVDVTSPFGSGLVGTIGVAGIDVTAGGDAARSWTALDLGPASGGWAATRTTFGGGAQAVATTDGDPLRATFATDDPLPGLDLATVAFRPASLADLAATPVPAIVDRATLAASGAGIGEPLLVHQGFADTRAIAPVGPVETFPGAGDPGIAVLDLGTLQLLEYATEGTVTPPGEWWLATDGTDDAAAVRALAAGAFPLADVRSRAAETAARLADPIAVGLFGTLWLAAIAAVVLAALSLGAAAWASSRARRGEVAVLRALGLPRRDLAAWLLMEQAFPVVTGLAGGLVLGVALAAVVLPATTRAPDGAPPVPPALVAIPWDVVAGAALAGAAAILATGLLLVRGAGGPHVAETLRNDAPGSGG